MEMPVFFILTRKINTVPNRFFSSSEITVEHNANAQENRGTLKIKPIYEGGFSVQPQATVDIRLIWSLLCDYFVTATHPHGEINENK